MNLNKPITQVLLLCSASLFSNKIAPQVSSAILLTESLVPVEGLAQNP